MARQFGFAPASAARQQDDSWKAGGFINIHVNFGEGRTPKLGAIPLKLANADEKALLDWLAQNPEAHTKELASRLLIDFKVVRNDGSKFVGLPGLNASVKSEGQGESPFKGS